MPGQNQEYFSNDSSYGAYNLSQVPGLDFGNPLLNFGASMLMGGRMFPRPVPGTNQSPFDAVRWQQRNLNYFAIRNQEFANQMLFERIGGMNPNGILTPLLSDPNGMASRLIAPFAGGNPVAAAMSAYGNLTTQSLAGLGRGPGEITPMETGQMMKSLSYKFYDRDISSADDQQTSRLVGEALNDKISALLADAAKKPKGINWEGTRGFKLEDIMGGFTAAARTGLFTSNLGAVGGFNEFLGLGKDGVSHGQASASIKLMDAMRGVFGNDKSGSQLVDATSALLGTDSISNNQDTAKLEDMLRRVKSTARVLAVDVGVMTAMAETFKDFARQNNIPFSSGGMGAMESSINAMGIMTLAKGSSGGWSGIRLAGGEVAYANELVATDANANVQPLTKWLGAVYHKAGVAGNTGVQANIANFLSDPNRDTSYGGYNKQLNAAAKALGMSAFELQNFAQNNVGASTLGLTAIRVAAPDATVTAIGTDLLSKFRTDLASAHGGNGYLATAMMAMTGNANLTAEQAAGKFGLNDDKSLATLRSVEAERSKGGFNLYKLAAGFSNSDVIVSANQAHYAAAEHALRKGYDPAYAAKQRALNAQTSYFKSEDERMSAKLAKFNAPVLTQIANLMFSGKLNEGKGIAGFLEDFQLDPQSVIGSEVAGLLSKANDITNKTDAEYKAGGFEYSELAGKDIAKLSPELKDKLRDLDPRGKLTSLSGSNVRNAHVTKLWRDLVDKRLQPIIAEQDAKDTSEFNRLFGSLGDLGPDFSISKLKAEQASGNETDLVKKYKALVERNPTRAAELSQFVSASGSFVTELKGQGEKAVADFVAGKLETEYKEAIKNIAEKLSTLVETLASLSNKTN